MMTQHYSKDHVFNQNNSQVRFVPMKIKRHDSKCTHQLLKRAPTFKTRLTLVYLFIMYSNPLIFQSNEG